MIAAFILLAFLSEETIAQGGPTPGIMQIASSNCVDYVQSFALTGTSGCSSIFWSATGNPTKEWTSNTPDYVEFYWSNPGTYVVTANYTNCSTGGSGSATKTVVINAPTVPDVTITRNPSSSTVCQGTEVTFMANPSNATIASYSWRIGGTEVSSSQSFSRTINSNTTVELTFNVHDACVSPQQIVKTSTVNTYPTPQVRTINGDSYCASESGGTISVSSSQNNYKYYLYQGSSSTILQTITGNGGTVSFSPRPAGNYTVKASHPNCTSLKTTMGTANITLQSNPPGLLDVVGSSDPNNLCQAEDPYLRAGVGTNYQWYRNSSLLPEQQNPTYNPNTAADVGMHTYRVTYNSSDNCGNPITKEATKTVTVEAELTPAVYFSASPFASTYCRGTTVTLTPHASSYRGNIISYEWKSGSTVIGTSSTLSNYVLNDPTETITLKITVPNSCVSGTTAQYSKTFTTYPVPVTKTLRGFDYCDSQTGGRLRVESVQAGIRYFVYNSANALQGSDVGSEGSNIEFTNLPEDTYTVKAEPDGTSCGKITMGSAEINVLDDPEGTLAVVTPSEDKYNLCLGDSPYLMAGTGNINYTWFRNGIEQTEIEAPVYTLTAVDASAQPRVYRVTYDGSDQCGNPYTYDKTVTVMVNTVLQPTVGIDVDATEVCENTTVNLTPVLGQHRGVESYSWKVGGTEVATSAAYSPTVSATTTFGLTVNFTDNCIDDNFVSKNASPIEVEVTDNLDINATLYGPNMPICEGATNNSFYVDITGEGIEYPVTISWYKNGWPINDNGQSGTPAVYQPTNPLFEGDYVYCTVLSSTPCVSETPVYSNTIEVTTEPAVPASLSYEIVGDNVICDGEEITFRVVSNAPMSNIYWYLDNPAYLVKEAGTGATFTTDKFSPETVLQVSANLSSPDGCVILGNNPYTASTNVPGDGPPVTVHSIPYAEFHPNGVHKCNTCSVTINAETVPGYSYQWYYNDTPMGGETGASLTTSLQGTYRLETTNAGGCSALSEGSLELAYNQPPTVALGADMTETLPVQYITIPSVVTDNDSESLTYAWTQESGPQVTLTGMGGPVLEITDIQEGTYNFRLTVTDELLATGSDLIQLTVINDPENYNYIQVHTIKEPGNTTVSQVESLDVDDKNVAVTYYDGLGRPMQGMQWQASDGRKNIVQHREYDEYGREAVKYLPFVSDDNTLGFESIARIKQSDFYTADVTSNPLTAGIARDSDPFAVTMFDNSPLHRPEEQGSPGTAWQPGTDHTIKMGYATNIANEVVLWTVTSAGVLKIDDGQSYYTENTLYKNITTDEEGNKVIEYTDLQGRSLLKKTELAENAVETSHDGWACTYYVYDAKNQLRFVLQPQWVENVKGNFAMGYTPSQTSLDELAFQYRYDTRNRMTHKKVPGAAWIYMVYDNRDRLVLTQDGNQRSTEFGGTSGKEWTFTKYDVLNRPVMTGIYTHGGPETTQADMQTLVNTEIADETDFFEILDGSGDHGYSNRMFPTVNVDILSVTYYDGYAFLGQTYFNGSDAGYNYDNSVFAGSEYPGEHNSFVKGQVTGSKVKVLDPNGAAQYLKTITYYDDRYRVVQSVTENHLGGKERMANYYDDLTANVKESKTISTEPEVLTVHRTFTYDHAQQLQEIQHQINEEAPVTIVSNQYNELGELISKDLNKENGNSSWQTVDYRYNIRGWLTNINDANLSDADSLPADRRDLFGMELYYESGFDVPYFNGNISGVKWKTAVDEDRMAYGYRYDKLNRIINAHYVKGTNDVWGDEGLFNLEILPQGGNASGYDLNGNILNLKRYGLSENNPAAIDVLTYDYTGNQLNKVDDTGTQEGFKDGSNTGDDYTYDANGNMYVDNNKEITNITYNFLNLPMVIELTESRKIEYIYDAAGIKLAQRVYEDDTQAATKTTDYIGERIYETKDTSTPILQFLHHEEGRIIPPSSPPSQGGVGGGWEYQYHLKDHLGNTRLTFGEEKMEEYLATMEAGENRIIEETEMGFENITLTEYDDANMDHTHLMEDSLGNAIMPGASRVSYLDGLGSRIYGPAKSLKVMPGDQIDLSVFYKYAEIPGGSNEQVLGNLLLTAFGGAFASGGIDLAIRNQVLTADFLASGMTVAGGENSSEIPDAYLNYIIFDKDFKNAVGEKIPINSTGNIADMGDHGELTHTIAVSKEGYVYIYVSNETPGSIVYFDDLLISHLQSRIIQKDDYYPFGLSIAGLNASRENSLANKYLYNGKELQADFGLDWYDYGARMYDASIGRWSVSDPLTIFQMENSPYNYVYNDPVNYIDPKGMIGERTNDISSTFVDENGTIIYVDPYDSDYNIYLVHDVENWNHGSKDGLVIIGQTPRPGSLKDHIGKQLYDMNTIDFLYDQSEKAGVDVVIKPNYLKEIAELKRNQEEEIKLLEYLKSLEIERAHTALKLAEQNSVYIIDSKERFWSTLPLGLKIQATLAGSLQSNIQLPAGDGVDELLPKEQWIRQIEEKYTWERTWTKLEYEKKIKEVLSKKD